MLENHGQIMIWAISHRWSPIGFASCASALLSARNRRRPLFLPASRSGRGSLLASFETDTPIVLLLGLVPRFVPLHVHAVALSRNLGDLVVVPVCEVVDTHPSGKLSASINTFCNT